MDHTLVDWISAPSEKFEQNIQNISKTCKEMGER